MPHQLAVLTSGKRFKLLACGRRWGKTAIGLIACIEGHGAYRGQFRGALDGGRVWWVVPSYPIAAEVWRDLKRAVGDIATDKSEVERRVELPGGGSITVKSADNPDSLRGAGLDGVVIDEAAFCDEEVWTKAIPPTIADRLGWVMLLTTPNGLNWFHTLFDSAGTDGDWAVFQRPTSDNPIVSAAELLRAKRRMPLAAYLQEHEAVFTNIAGAVFPAEYFGDEIWVDELPDHIAFGVVSLDPSVGKDVKKGDYQAAVYTGVCHELCYVDAILDRCPIGQAVGNALTLCFRYGAKTLVYESNGFQAMIGAEIERQLQSHPLHGITVIALEHLQAKIGRIQSLDPFLANRELRFLRSPGCKIVVDQLRETPVGNHDDGPDALEMGVRQTLGQMHADEGTESNVLDGRGFV